MRGRVTAVPLLLVLLVSPAVHADCWSPRFSGEFRATAFDIATDPSGALWVATGYGLELFDRATATKPASLVASLAIPGMTRVVRVDANGTAYVGSGSRIYVVQRDGNALRLVTSVDAGATVNDIEIATYLFAATSNGVAHFDIFDPAHPLRTSTTLPTSSPNVTSLAIAGITLWAADTDNTLEIFSIGVPSLPQHTGTIELPSRASVVYATSTGIVFVSDRFAQSTDVYAGSTRISSLPYPAVAIAGSGSQIYIGGSDRTVHVVDASITSRIAERYTAQLPITDGTSNDVHALVRSGDGLYVAAGDIGLLSIDASALTSPSALAAYAGITTTSSAVNGSMVYFTSAAGDVTEYLLDASLPSLTPQRTWQAGAGAVLRDANASTLLTTSGTTAKVWSTSTATPSLVSSTTFAATIAGAVLRDQTVIAVLADGTVWTATGAQAPSRLTIGAPVTSIARAGAAVALSTLTDTTTVVRYYATGDLTAAPSTFTFDGLAIGGLALNDSEAAVFTFRGISVANLGTGIVTVIPSSNAVIPREITFAGANVALVSDRDVAIWSTSTRTQLRDVRLPLQAVSISASSPVAAIALNGGFAVLRADVETPHALAAYENSFYTRVAAGPDRLYLLSRDSVTVSATNTGAVPRYVATIPVAGAIDLAATSSGVVVLFANGTVTSYSRTGAPLAQTTIDEGADMQLLSITTAANAVWVSLSKGCLSGTCERKTIVLDPSTLAQTTSMTGQVKDVAVVSNRAYVLTSVPAEVRILDVTDPLHPAQLASIPAPTLAASITADSTNVYVLGDKLYVYRASSLAAVGDHLTTAASAPDTQRVRIDSGCAAIVGRTTSVDLYAPSTWTGTSTTELPATVRAVASVSGRLYILTDDSVEVWTQSAPPAPGKRRSSR